MRIYVVDDETVTARLIASILTKAGHEVSAFADGSLAWEAYSAEPVPLVVTDWMMPQMSGIELCKKIRGYCGAVYTNVIVVTNLSFSEHASDAFEAGADDMLGKPLDPQVLLGRVAATQRGQLAQAELALRQCLDICQRSLGPEHGGLLEALKALCEVSRQQRSYVRCRAFVRRQIAIAKASFGPSDPRTLELLKELDAFTAIEDRM
jgi:DNA-binding response OmpR family regulator